jgi:hypothetical protein
MGFHTWTFFSRPYSAPGTLSGAVWASGADVVETAEIPTAEAAFRKDRRVILFSLSIHEYLSSVVN